MPSPPLSIAPGLPSFLKSLKTNSVDFSIDHLIALLRRRQIKNSRPCAVATAHLLLRVVSSFRLTDVGHLIERIKQVGQRLCAAQPRELVIGNIVRRVLGLIREELEADRDERTHPSSETGAESPVETSASRGTSHMSRPGLASSISTFSPLRHGVAQPTDTPSMSMETISELGQSTHRSSPGPHSMQRPSLTSSHTSYAVHNAAPMATSMFDLLSHEVPSPVATPPSMHSPQASVHLTAKNLAKVVTASQRDLKPDIIGGIEEIIDELSQVDEQIASYALEHIHSNEIILTHSTSVTVQKFLLKAAAKRKFTVVHAESYPNDEDTPDGTFSLEDVEDDMLSPEAFRKPLTTAGVTVIVISDAAVFALMSRVNKVILGTHAVLANGGLVAPAGARMIAKAARTHRTPVVIVSGVYKLSPVYPFDFEALIEYGDAGKVFPYHDGEMVDLVEVENPLYDYVPAELVDLYITNLGGHAPSYLYRIVSDHYRVEDINLQQ
ncbi:MAG: monothiol glutaredoxin grx5 [Watsoniomyces obsoletus]|nr:MAG: monothiol glutaredoxin grx5 [Watsoniomyces obsoletus]